MSRGRPPLPCLKARALPFIMGLLAIQLVLAPPAVAWWFTKIVRLAEDVPGPAPGTSAGAASSGRWGSALHRSEAVALAGVVSGSAIYADMVGGQLILEAVRGGARAVIDLGDDVAGKLAAAMRAMPTAGGQVIAISDDTARALGQRLDGLISQADVRILRRGFPPLPVTRLDIPGSTPRYFVQFSPGLVAPLEVQLSEEMARILTATVRRDAIRVMPLFSTTDVDTLLALANAAGDRMVDLRSFIQGSARLQMKEMQDKLVIAVGHVEGDAFAVRNASGALERRIPFSELEREARESNATIMLSAGCRCFAEGAASGFVRPITDLEVAASLRAALEARTNAEFFASFGQPGNPFVITGETLQRLADDQAFRLERLARHDAAVQGASISIRIFSAVRQGSVLGPVLEGILGWYVIGWFGVLFLFRHSRDQFRSLFPVLPNPVIRPFLARICLVLREAIFWCLAPFVGGMVLLFVLFGGWKSRGELHALGWSAVLKPTAFLFSVAYMLISLVITLFILVSCFGLMAAMAVPLVSWIFDQSQTAGVVLGIAGILVSLWLLIVAFGKIFAVVAAVLDKAIQRYPLMSYAVGIVALPLVVAVAAFSEGW
ncbi:hypothetical protein [Falsiroseomonas tokyonensis]|uniref:CHASE2 domain-containing protein n=1 Tax=Falsiroseomonas tokyonensis TaxID=430521 RepID=A0ABV7BVL3_9PROT|nr:hypothetical protein [Falsiroseomonas tokyonensis]MBU8538652.1 hypothetical protein [Falsiroseomonas tokyonensis]